MWPRTRTSLLKIGHRRPSPIAPARPAAGVGLQRPTPAARWTACEVATLDGISKTQADLAIQADAVEAHAEPAVETAAPIRTPPKAEEIQVAAAVAPSPRPPPDPEARSSLRDGVGRDHPVERPSSDALADLGLEVLDAGDLGELIAHVVAHPAAVDAFLEDDAVVGARRRQGRPRPGKQRPCPRAAERTRRAGPPAGEAAWRESSIRDSAVI